VAAIVLFGASLLGASSAQACSCVGPDPEAGYASFLEEADGAIVAKLIDVRPIGNGRRASFHYRVLEVYKRPNRFNVGERRRVVSATDSVACGIGYPVGSTHGVFLYRQRGHFTSSLCSTISSKDMREAAKVPSGERPASHRSGSCRYGGVLDQSGGARAAAAGNPS